MIFYLPDHNLLIEYDGEFHYQSIAGSNLQKQKIRDRYKNMWARKNNYKLIRINYKQNLLKELDKILNNELQLS